MKEEKGCNYFYQPAHFCNGKVTHQGQSYKEKVQYMEI